MLLQVSLQGLEQCLIASLADFSDSYLEIEWYSVYLNFTILSKTFAFFLSRISSSMSARLSLQKLLSDFFSSEARIIASRTT